MSAQHAQDVFSDRFSEEYLTHLLEQLRPEALLRSAILLPKEHTNKQGIVKTFKKCVSIDFCGLAANTLLGASYGRRGSPRAQALLIEIAEAFIKLFTVETLDWFNKKHGVYVKVRMSFAYLYSDFPICLMKAELPKNWRNINAEPYNFHISEPLTIEQFQASFITRSQQYNLGILVEILRSNEELIFDEGNHEPLNTIELRFPVMPIPGCLLFINETAYSDGYLYAKVDKDPHLSLHYPVCVIRKKENLLQFESVRKHWDFLWQHDLSLFCRDVTAYTPELPEGLMDVKHPFSDAGEPNIKWEYKLLRIERKLKKAAKKAGQPYVRDDKMIVKWKENLTDKLRRCTAKLAGFKPQVGALSSLTDRKNLFTKERWLQEAKITIRLNMDKGMCYQILNGRQVICERSYPGGTTLFKALAHYGYAKVHKQYRPIMHQIYANGSGSLKKELLNQIRLNRKDDMIPEDWIFDAIFETKAEQEGGMKTKYSRLIFTFKLDAKSVNIDESDVVQIKRAEYSREHGALRIAVSCLQYDLGDVRDVNEIVG